MQSTHARQAGLPFPIMARLSSEAWWARALAAMALLLVLVLAPGEVAADATLTIGSATVAPGASVDLPVTLTTSQALSFLKFDVTYSISLCGVIRERGTDTSITGVVIGADEGIAVGKDIIVRGTTSLSQVPQEEPFSCNGGHMPIAVFNLSGGAVIAAGTATIFRIQFDVRADAAEGSYVLTPSNILAKDGPITVLVIGQAGTLTIKRPPPPCGDGKIDPPEQCDDGNTESGDGCSETCQIERRLDDFFCYASRPTKGMFCSAEAGDRAGDTCEDEEDCGGVTGDEDTDGTSLCLPNKFPKGLQVAVADGLEAGVRIFDVKKPVNLCTPAATNGDGVSDAATHLEGFQLTLTKGKCAAGAPMHAGLGCTKEADCGGGRGTQFCVTQAKAVPRTDIQVVDQFHPAEAPLRVDAVKPDRLLVPTAKGLTEPVALPGPNEVDHYKCYTAKVTKGAPKFTPILIVAIDDQFTTGARLFSLTKPTRLCTPADLNGEGIKDASTGLMCYEATAVKGVCAVEAPTNRGGVCGKEQDCGGTRQTHFCGLQARFQGLEGLFVNNQFGPSQLDTTKEEELCVPSTTAGVGP